MGLTEHKASFLHARVAMPLELQAGWDFPGWKWVQGMLSVVKSQW